MNRVLLALIVMVCAASPALADVGPFLPAQQYAKAVHRIEIAEEQPDYVFVVARQNGPPKINSEHTFVTLKPGQPLELTGERYDQIELFIVRRSAAKPYSTAQQLVAAAEKGEVPAVRHRFSARVTVASWNQSAITVTYRVQPTSSGGLEIARTSWDPLWQWYIAALLLPLAVLLCGFWLVRRVFRRPRKQAVA